MMTGKLLTSDSWYCFPPLLFGWKDFSEPPWEGAIAAETFSQDFAAAYLKEVEELLWPPEVRRLEGTEMRVGYYTISECDTNNGERRNNWCVMGGQETSTEEGGLYSQDLGKLGCKIVVMSDRLSKEFGMFGASIRDHVLVLNLSLECGGWLGQIVRLLSPNIGKVI